MDACKPKHNLKMDDEKEISSPVELPDRNWNRVISAATKAGYREGIEEGKQSVFQEGFDIGYEDAFKTAFILGKYKGLATSLADERGCPSPIGDILDKTRRGACYICGEISKENKVTVDDFTEQPLQEVRNDQRKCSEEAIGSLRQHFDKLLKDRGLSIDNFTI